MTRAPCSVATRAVASVEQLSTTTTSSTIAGICARTATMPSCSLWQGITTEMRLPRYIGGLQSVPARRRCRGWVDAACRRAPRRVRPRGARPHDTLELSLAAGRRLRHAVRVHGAVRDLLVVRLDCRVHAAVPRTGESRGRGLRACELAQRAAHLETPPLLQDLRHHPRVEEDVDGEEAFVGAEALGVADETPRLVRLLAVPDLLEIVAGLAHVTELTVDEKLAGVEVTVREHAGAEAAGIARDLVRVGLGDLRDQPVPHDTLGIDDVGDGERVVARERAAFHVLLDHLGVLLVALHVEELRDRFLGAATREQREHVFNLQLAAKVLVVLH